MLRKLLKYDLKYMLINMCVFYILTLFFAITTRICFALNQTVVINVLGKISSGCMIAMIFNIIINTMMRSWVRFKNFLYKDEAYLTHTLPVTKRDIYESKFVQTVVFTVVGFIAVIVGLLISYYTKQRWILLKDLINNISKGINISALPFVISVIVIFFLEILNGIQSGYLGIILGHKYKHKTGLSVIFGFVSYIISQAFVIIAIYILGFFNKDIASLFNSNVILNAGIIKTVIIFAMVIYTVIIIIMNVLCVKLLNKGVNIE